LAKVVIIGGGWSGCAAALTARKAGAEVELLERTDMLLGSGLVGGIFRNNGRFTAAEEMIALGGGELFNIMDSLARHVNIEFPGHKHSSLYDAARIEPEVHRLLKKIGVKIKLQTRIIELEKEKDTIISVSSEDGEKYSGDVFIDCTGTAANTGNCVKYGNGCAMCVYRCPTFKTRVSISEKAGIKDMIAMRPDGTPGVFSGSCKIMKHTLSSNIIKELDEKGVSVVPIPKELIDESKLSKKACVQYALPEYSQNIVLLDTGFAKLMTPFFPLELIRQIPGFENARYEDPYSGGIGNSIRYMAMAPRDNALRVLGIRNLFCAGEKSGLIVGHTEVIVTGSLAGYNSLKQCEGEEVLILPNKLAVGDILSYSNTQMNTKEGLKKRYTFAGGLYLERMIKLGLYTININEIKERVEKLGLKNIFT
jgi:hypothetical protein